jgi:hypothetical protein
MLTRWFGLVLAGMLTPMVRALAQPTELRVQIPGWDVPILLDTIASKREVKGPRDKVLAAITATFAEYDLPAEGIDPTISRVPNRRVMRRGKLGKQPISRYLDCGRGFAGNHADVYRIVVSSAAWPEPDTGDVATIKVAIIGAGQDPAGASKGFVQCHTRGFFEPEFARKVQARVVQAMDSTGTR